MASASRNYILSRRGAGIGDLSGVTLENGDWSIEECEKRGMYQINCKHQIGIATETEVGLSADRFPIRVVIMADPTKYSEEYTDACVSYWRLINAESKSIRFSRKPIATELPLRNLYKYVQDVDGVLWAHVDRIGASVVGSKTTEATAKLMNELYDLLSLALPTDEQAALIGTTFGAIVDAFTELNMYALFKVGDGVYLHASPHGHRYGSAVATTSTAAASADRIALFETVLCMAINRARLKKSYDMLQDGVITLGAYSIANMFRCGLQECYEHREYYTAVFQMAASSQMSFVLHSLHAPPGIVAPTDHGIPSTVDVSKLKLKKQLVEIANLMVTGSGLMHYLFNHTTGGMEVSGVLLSVLAMYGFVTQATTKEESLALTSMIYQCLHPTNKRAIANILFKNSGVMTHGRSSKAPRYGQFHLDSFTALRANPFPAGSHKAYVCVTALKRVLQSGMGPFLPWAGEITACVTLCQEVLKGGARAHIGSAYYTGEPPRTQPSSLDRFLPALAAFLHTFHKQDSLTQSPHMSIDQVKRADMNWQALLREMKGNDISATSVDKVRSFLSTTGGIYFNFDPEKEETWAGASQAARGALTVIDSIFV